ncbi:MAG: methyl-accepting chemotaxis protein [Lachnospiraceae bacterium]|nr:methyl-accepting chemotaxis protein [Lachnospiraceae bacterium]
MVKKNIVKKGEEKRINKYSRKESIKREKNRRLGIYWKLIIPALLLVSVLAYTLKTVSYNEQKKNIVNDISQTTSSLAKLSLMSIKADEIIEIRDEMDVIKSSYINISDLFKHVKQSNGLKHIYTVYQDGDILRYGVDSENEQGTREFPGVEVTGLTTEDIDMERLKKEKVYSENKEKYNKDKQLVMYTYGGIFNENKEIVAILICEYSAESMIKSLEELSKTFNSVIIICLIVVSIILTVVVLSVVRNINHINNKIYNLASSDGDLSQTLVINSKDEISYFAELLNKLILYIKNIMITIKDNSNRISCAVDNVSNNLEIVQKNMSDTDNKIENIDKSVSNMSELINNVNGVSEEVKDRVYEIIELLKTATKHVDSIKEQSANSSDNAKITREEANEKISSIQKKIIEKLEMSKNVSLIEDLAKQIIEITEETHLLAMNANVKAVRAGEQGKGFVVVANEIGNLAVTTEEAAVQIQKSSASIIETVNDLSESIVEMLEYVNTTTGVVFEDLVDKSDVFLSSSNKVSSVLEAFSSATDTFLTRLNNITDSIGNVDSMISDSKHVIGDVSKMSSELSNEIQSINTNMEHTKEAGKTLYEDVNIFKL